MLDLRDLCESAEKRGEEEYDICFFLVSDRRKKLLIQTANVSDQKLFLLKEHEKLLSRKRCGSEKNV